MSFDVLYLLAELLQRAFDIYYLDRHSGIKAFRANGVCLAVHFLQKEIQLAAYLGAVFDVHNEAERSRSNGMAPCDNPKVAGKELLRTQVIYRS